jgi:predicted nucleic acid-binding protein
LSRFVLDASVTLCWCFENQATEYTEAIFERLAGGEEASVPFIWPLEVANVLVTAERRKALKLAQVTGFLEELSAWPIQVDTLGVDRAFQHILNTARSYNLSTFDAAYLELAVRRGLPLATLDKDLKKSCPRGWRQDRWGKIGIQVNPLRAGLVNRAEDWPCSSVRDYSGSSSAPVSADRILAVDRILLPADERTRI